MKKIGFIAWIGRHRFVSGVIIVFLVIGLVDAAVGDAEEPRDSAGNDPTSSTPIAEDPSSIPPAETVNIPNVKGMSIQKALGRLDAVGLLGRTEKKYSKSRPGIVLLVKPTQGGGVTEGERVTLVIAQPYPTVPEVIGGILSKASALLKAAGYDVTIVKEVSPEPVGTVIRTTPGTGSSLLPGKTVTLVVAKEAPSTPTPTNCTPGYSPCLPPASDYDCAGGSGDGPAYTGSVTVTGSDPFGLDSDGDGYGCES